MRTVRIEKSRRELQPPNSGFGDPVLKLKLDAALNGLATPVGAAKQKEIKIDDTKICSRHSRTLVSKLNPCEI